MTNEQKALELEKTYNNFTYQACIAMAQWKDEQFAKEKKEIDEQWKRLMAESKSIGVDLLQRKDEQFQKVLDYAEICYVKQRESFINHIKEIFYGKE